MTYAKTTKQWNSLLISFFSTVLISYGSFSLSPDSARAVEDKGVDSQNSAKAVLEISKEKGFRLSESALKTIHVATRAIDSGPVHSVEKRAIVYSRDHVGVYRLREGWFKLIEVEILSHEAGTSSSSAVSNSILKVRSKELEAGDQIAFQGVPLLRVAEMDAFSGSAGEK